MKPENVQSFSLVKLFVVIGALALLAIVLIPAISKAKLEAGLHTAGYRGKNIFTAIVGASLREPGISYTAWPKAQIDGNAGHDDTEAQDASGKTFSNSTRYFYELYDGANIGTKCWEPIVSPEEFDFSKLAGAGVPEMVGTGALRPENNMWCVAGNLHGDMDEIVPVLVTRNVDCSSFRIKTQGSPDTRLQWSQQYKTPFGKKGFALIRKGGAIFYGTAKNATTGAVYPMEEGVYVRSADGNANFASLVYLTPDGIAYPQ